jgi:hypothetical protein
VRLPPLPPRPQPREGLPEREVPEGEADASGDLLLDTLDLTKCLPRIGAFVVAVLEDETPGERASDMI